MHTPTNPVFKKSFILIICLFFSVIVHAQTKWEQLEPTLKDSSEAAALKFYTAACKDLFFSNRKISESFANKAYNIAFSNSIYKNEKSDLSNMLGVINMYNANFEVADKYLKAALTLAKEQNNETLILKALGNLALNSSKKGNYQQAIVQMLEVIPLAEKKGDMNLLANNYANLSNAYYYLNQLKNSEIYQLKALELFEKINYQKGISNAYNTLGSIYTDKKEYDKAIYYFNKSIKIKEKANDSLGVANTYDNMAELYKKLNNYTAELEVLQKAEKIFLALKDKEGLAKIYNNLGTYYYGKNDFTRAIVYQKKSIALSQKGKDQYLLSSTYENIAKTYSQMNHSDSALAFAKKALSAKDSLVDIELQKKVTEMEIKYQTEKKEKLISEQQLQLNEKELAIVRRNNTIAVTTVSILLILATSFFLFRQNKLKNKAQLQHIRLEQQQLSTKAILEAEENERQRIAKDLHDGIGQMMSVAKMNLSTMESELNLDAEKKIKLDRIIGLVDESCKEVRAVSHNLMPNALLKAGLSAAIREFIEKIDHHDLQIDIHSQGLQDRLDADTETVLYRVIQESVNNVIKHADANRLDISLINDEEGISVTVDDNGKGFNTATVADVEGIGLKNMKTRIEYLKGTIEWNSSPGKGTLVAIHIPSQA